MTDHLVIPTDPWSPAFDGPGMYYVDGNGVWKPVGGTFSVGKIPVAQGDDTVIWATPDTGCAALLEEGEFIYEDGVLLTECDSGNGGGGGGGGGTESTTVPADLYIASSGDDLGNDGSSGSPFETMAHALSVLPSNMGGQTCTIHCADATYAEPIVIDRFVNGLIIVSGNTTTPANVTFTGTTNYLLEAYGGYTTVGLVTGNVMVEFEGLRTNATADNGITVLRQGRLLLDRCTVAGSTNYAILAREQAFLELQGNITVSGFASSGRGISIAVLSAGVHSSPGTLTITGPGGSTTSTGVDVAYNSTWRANNGQPGINVTITGVQYGYYVAVGSSFQHHGPTPGSFTITVDNATTPTASDGLHCGEASSFSVVNGSVNVDHFTNAFHTEFLGFLEHVLHGSGTRTVTNCSNTSVADDNSYINLAA